MWTRANQEPVTATDIRKSLKYGLLFVSAVLVALFVQKSDGNSALETIFYLALGATGSLAVATGVIGIRYARRFHDHEWAWYYSKPYMYFLVLATGLAAVVFSFNVIDREDSDFLTGSGVDEFTADAGGVAVRNLYIAESDQYIRFVVSIVNATEAPVVLDEAQFDVQIENTATSCAGDFPIYRLDDPITVRDGNIEGAKLLAEGGPLQGFEVASRGRLEFFCADTELSLSFPVNIGLGPLQTTYLALDLPNMLNVTLEDMILYNEANRGKYPIGSQDTVALQLNLADLASDEIATMTARVRHSSNDIWACVSKNSRHDDDATRLACRSEEK